MLRLRKDAEGASMVEYALVISFILLLVGGVFDFMYNYWQLNMAMKAVERGARIAAVSDPVASGLRSMNTVIGTAGTPYPAGTFDCVCNGATKACTAGATGPCALGFDATALNTIVYGRGNGAACNFAAANVYAIGMCNLFQRITPANVVVEYSATGLGFQGRPCGPSPTIALSLQNVEFDFIFLSGLMNLGKDLLGTTKATITGEDLASASPPGC
jgi:Flp pilus assembly protein TadG